MISKTFREVGLLFDGDLQLRIRELFPGDTSRAWVPAYRFDMVVAQEVVGAIELRLGAAPEMVQYGGQIAYGVAERHQGQRYAARSVRLLLPLACSHGFGELWITCDPDNWASRRTCELAGAVLVEVVELPRNSDMYERGERQKCRYRLSPCPGR